MGWGEHLQLRIGQRNLSPIVADIKTVTGGALGSSRNTYAALFSLDVPPVPHSRDYDRAYMLLVAVGEDPVVWDIDQRQVSPLIRAGRDLLVSLSRWTTHPLSEPQMTAA